MGKGNYLGGGTIFTYADLDWFGAGGVEVPREERKERIKKELIRQRQQGLPPNPSQRDRASGRWRLAHPDLENRQSRCGKLYPRG